MWIRNPLRLLRAGPFDTSTSVGREDQRVQRAVWASGANFASKLSSLVLVFVSVHSTISYLGKERFGMWMTIFSFISMLSFLDLGIGNALTNRVAFCAAQHDASRLQSVIGGGLGTLLLVSVVMSALLLLMASIVPWQMVIHGNNAPLLIEGRSTAQVFALAFGLTTFASGVQKLFLGLQRSHEAHLATCIATIITAAVIAFAARGQPGVPALLAITMIGQSLGVFALLTLLLKRRQLCRHSLLINARRDAPEILRSGGPFLFLQIATMVGWGADPLIVSSTLGVGQVAVLSVTQRLFQFASTPVAIINQPLWGAFADAYVRDDNTFIGRTLRRSVLLSAGAAVSLSSVLLLFHGSLIGNWTKGAIEVPVGFLCIYALWSVMEAAAGPFAMYLNGCGVIRPQMWAALLFCVLSIPLKFVLAGSLHLPGVVLATIVSWVISIPLLYATFFRAEVSRPARIRAAV
jgi:O-antigen/teichoic acid export membrane protein